MEEIMREVSSSVLGERNHEVGREQRAAQRVGGCDRREARMSEPIGGPLLMLLHADGRIVRFNQACERAFGWSAGEAVGRILWECSFVPAQPGFALLRAVRELATGCGVRFNDSFWRHRDGGLRIIQWTAEAIGDAEEAVQCIALAGIDRTAMSAARGSVHRRFEQIADLHRLHIVEGLGTVVAHDLNQPLAALGLLAESALRRGQAQPSFPADLIEDLEAIVLQARRAGSITSRLRAFVAGAPVPEEAVDVGATIRGTCELLLPEARAHRVELRVHAEPTLPPVKGDMMKLGHVLATLVMNGIEAIRDAGQPTGSIEINAIAQAQALSITVIDSGPGVNPSLANKVFQPFYSTKQDGLGLGLAIGRELTQQLGGSLWAESRSGAGIFHLRLPICE